MPQFRVPGSTRARPRPFSSSRKPSIVRNPSSSLPIAAAEPSPRPPPPPEKRLKFEDFTDLEEEGRREKTSIFVCLHESVDPERYAADARSPLSPPLRVAAASDSIATSV